MTKKTYEEMSYPELVSYVENNYRLEEDFNKVDINMIVELDEQSYCLGITEDGFETNISEMVTYIMEEHGEEY